MSKFRDRIGLMVPRWVAEHYRWLKMSHRFRGARIDRGAFVCEHSVLGENSAALEKSVLIDTSLGRSSYTSGMQINASIGSFSSIAPGAVIGGGIHPVQGWVSTSPLFYRPTPWLPNSLESEFLIKDVPRTIVGSDVWIGYGAIVLPGVIVGDGAVIGAGSVVTRDVDPYMICVGSPAKKLRPRFTDKQIEVLLNSKWWDWSLERIRENREMFRDISVFLEKTADA